MFDKFDLTPAEGLNQIKKIFILYQFRMNF
jgi:hypothetical protein